VESATESFVAFFHSMFVSPLFLKTVRAVGVAIVFEALEFVINRRIDRMLAAAFRLDQAEESGWRVRRRKTLQAVPKRANQLCLYSVAMLMILRIFGVETTGTVLPVAAILAVVGALALRGLLADVSRGYVILLEHWYAPGHRACVNGIEGTVANVTLTATLLRTDDGEMVRIPNGDVERVVDRGRPAVSASPSEPAASVRTQGPSGAGK
jgi:small-conductance mechanosensitive channel